MHRRRFLTCSAALLAAGHVPGALHARRLFPDDTTDRYVAWQGDRPIGRQAFSFSREPGRFLVEGRLEMRFTVPGRGDIGYEHESREAWDTGWLQSLESQTRVDGRVREVRAERDGGALLIEGSEVPRPYRMSSYVVPSNLWHRDSRLTDAFIDVENGSILFVRPRFVARETLHQGGDGIETHRYAIRGQMDRDAWYDADCVLVRWDLPLSSGGWISFRREAA